MHFTFGTTVTLEQSMDFALVAFQLYRYVCSSSCEHILLHNCKYGCQTASLQTYSDLGWLVAAGWFTQVLVCLCARVAVVVVGVGGGGGRIRFPTNHHFRWKMMKSTQHGATLFYC
eukprot:m.64271 g.64271  ORF g.64271 m.64271 type:complete len:116 (-) comp11999_c0_seq2:560-907(-)